METSIKMYIEINVGAENNTYVIKSRFKSESYW